MTTSFIESWDVMEQRCRGYINEAIGTVEGVTAFSEETFPRVMPGDGEKYFVWKLVLNGGPVTVHRQTREALQGGVWQMDGEFRALCVDDATAKLVGGMVFDALPATGDDVEGLSRLYATAYPSRERTLANLMDDDNAGQEQVFYQVTVPLVAVFSNVTQ